MRWIQSTLLMCMVLLFAGCSELRKSEARIQQDILEVAPIGSDMSTVISMLQQKGYEIVWINRNSGFSDQRVRPAKVKGEMSIRSNFGDYRGFIFMVNVTVFFAFDEEGKLLDVWVWKTKDAP